MFRFSKPETPRAAFFVFLRNETRAKSGFVSYVSISLCFDFDPRNREVEAVPGGKIRMHLLISLNLRMRLL